MGNDGRAHQATVATTGIKNGEDGGIDMRGKNQSVDTKFATCLVCDAIDLLNTGRVELARKRLVHAVTMLPDVLNNTQKDAAEEYRRTNRGMPEAA